MKKFLSIVLVFTFLIMGSSCNKTDSNSSKIGNNGFENQQQLEKESSEQLLKEAENIAQIVAEHVFYNRAYDVIPYLAVDIGTMLNNHPFGKTVFINGRIEHDGIAFETANDLFKMIQESFEYTNEHEYENVSFKISESVLSDNVDGLIEDAIRNEYSNLRGEPLSENSEEIKKSYESMYVFKEVEQGAKVIVEITVTSGDKISKATICVYLLNINDEWKIISPTPVGMQAGMLGPNYRYIKLVE